MKNTFISVEPSFRDPSGFIFKHDGILYRCIMHSYKEHFEQLINSGLSDKLINDNLLLPFRKNDTLKTDEYYLILKPKFIKHISYPYEWSFSQLKDAALLTLRIAKISLDYNMILKDASGYNIQFVDGKAQFIDTLSFEIFQPNKPWVAYRQFCQHFLSPLLLMQYKSISLNSLLVNNLDGIPIALTNELLGFRKYLPKAFFHIFLQTKLSTNHTAENRTNNRYKFSKKDHYKIIDNLIDIISGLEIKIKNDFWSDYYKNKILNDSYLAHKEEIVSDYLSKIRPETVYDFGANTGFFSRTASQFASHVISTDIDPECVEINYRNCKKENNSKILPLILDLTNPSPSIGWNNKERDNFYERITNDTIMALALVHHLVISNNLPLEKLASFFNNHCNKLIIEFIPLTDPKVQLLLKNKPNIYHNYTRSKFEECFRKYFEIVRFSTIKESERVIYFMRKSNG